MNYLFDSNVSTNSDFRLGSSSGVGSYVSFDFKAGNQAALSGVELLTRQDNNLQTRIVGTVVQGSNDDTDLGDWLTTSKRWFQRIGKTSQSAAKCRTVIFGFTIR